MEKKITKKFYYLSGLNLITAGILGQLVWKDTLALTAVLLVLVFNHTILVNMVTHLSQTLVASDNDAKRALRKTLLLMFTKMTLMVVVMLLVYFYNQSLVLKVVILVIFQLIIQVVSIKNNY